MARVTFVVLIFYGMSSLRHKVIGNVLTDAIQWRNLTRKDVLRLLTNIVLNHNILLRCVQLSAPIAFYLVQLNITWNAAFKCLLSRRISVGDKVAMAKCNLLTSVNRMYFIRKEGWHVFPFLNARPAFAFPF